MNKPTASSTNIVNSLHAAIGRSTSRLLAAAVSMLLLSAVVVVRSDRVLSSDATTGGNVIAAGTVELRDDDEGRSLFGLTDLGPDRPVARCVEVDYVGTIVPAAIWLTVRGTGELAPYVSFTVEKGTGGSFDDCTDFVAEETVVDDLLSTVTRATSASALQVVDVDIAPLTTTFRVTVEIVDNGAAAGLAASIDLFWETAPR